MYRQGHITKSAEKYSLRSHISLFGALAIYGDLAIDDKPVIIENT